MLTGLLCVFLGSAHAGDASDLRNQWSGEYDMPGNISIMASPLSMWDRNRPMLDLTAEVRTGESGSFAVTAATDLPGRPLGDLIGVARAPHEVGFQLREYVAGNFDNGLFIGGHVNFTNPDIRRFHADRTTVGPMAGIKVTLAIFSVQARGGAAIDLAGVQGFRITPVLDFATGFTF